MSEERRLRLCFETLAGFLVATTVLVYPLSANDSGSPINGIYRGTIGRQPIVLEIGVDLPREDNKNNSDSQDRKTYPIEGRYFYRRHGVDIHLVGMWLGDDTLRLREYRRAPDDEFGAEWRLRIRGDSAVGTFCECDLSGASSRVGPLLKISLKRLSREFYSESEPKDQDPYYDLVLDFPLKDGPVIEVNPGIAYTMQSDPRFGVSRPRLTRFPEAGVMARINRDLAAELRWDRWQAHGNLSEALLEASLGGFYDESTSVSFFPPDILSVRVDRSWYWGGAHPNSATYVRNYDLHTGRKFDLNHAFQTAEGGTAEGDLAGLIAKLYRRHYVKPVGPVAAEDCDDVLHRITSDKNELIDAFAPHNATFFVSGQGLVVIPTFLYADSGCGPDITIPYGELRPYVKKDSMLRLLVDHQAN